MPDRPHVSSQYIQLMTSSSPDPTGGLDYDYDDDAAPGVDPADPVEILEEFGAGVSEVIHEGAESVRTSDDFKIDPTNTLFCSSES